MTIKKSLVRKGLIAARFLAVPALLLVSTPGIAQSNPVAEAEQEIDEAFREASREVEEAADEATEEIGDAADEMKEELEQASTNASSISQEQATESKQAADEAIREAREAVIEMQQESEKAIREVRREVDDALEECRKDQGDRSHRGGGAFVTQLMSLDPSPLKTMNKKDLNMKGKVFDFDSKLTPMIGGIGYYDLGRGTRIGATAMLGSKKYQSSSYTSLDTNGLPHDSLMTLRVWPFYAGFNFEKSLEIGPAEIFAGGLFGGGVYAAYLKSYDKSEETFFYDGNTDTNTNFDEQFGALAFAPFAAWDVHGGIAVRLAPIFKIGIEAFAMFNYAPEGFGTGFGDFYTVNPGVRIRFIFGKSRSA